MNEEKILHDEALDEDSDWAFWFDGKNINEVMFCQYFLQLHPMKCVRGRLFTVDGIVEDEGEISQMILDEVRGCLTNGVAKAVSNLLASLKGAEKLTRYFGAILRDTHEIPDQRTNSHASAVWQARVDAYYARKAQMEKANSTP